MSPQLPPLSKKRKALVASVCVVWTVTAVFGLALTDVVASNEVSVPSGSHKMHSLVNENDESESSSPGSQRPSASIKSETASMGAADPATGAIGSTADSSNSLSGKNVTTQIQTSPSPTPSSDGSGDLVKPMAERSIIYTATLAINTSDALKARAAAMDIVTGSGGTLFNESSGMRDDRTISMTFKLPPDKFNATIDALTKVGELKNRSIQADDVTAQVTDLKGRITSAQASADRLRALMAKAGDIGQIAQIESELSRREAEIESMQGRLRLMESRVDYSTITLVLTQPAPVVVVADKELDGVGFMSGLRESWNLVKDTGTVIAYAFGYIVPIVPVALVIAITAVVGRKIHRSKRSNQLAAVPTAEA